MKKLSVVDSQIDTTCPYCGVGCGVSVSRQSMHRHQANTNEYQLNETLLDLSGDAKHPANCGKLCVKGTHLLDTNTSSGRLAHPQINGQQVSWSEALDEVAANISDVVKEHGPEAIAFYLSGQLLTEDYYVANKLLKGFIGSANVDTNSRLCMSSAVSAYKRAFGSDTVPCCYDDLSTTDLIVFVGSNAAWTHPVLYQQIQAAKAKNPNMKTVCVDPRMSATASESDLHLAIRPGSDAWLFNGLLRFMSENGALDDDYIATHTQGFEQAIAQAISADLACVAKHCDVPEQVLQRFYTLFINSASSISFYSMGVNQSTSGVDKANSIINCHLASGKIGKVGSGPFSITGQPNAMGGREVGGLANMLAAHMDIENPEHRSLVERFWQAPNIVSKQGLKAVDMFDAIAQGKIKFVWIMGTNPVVSMPNRNAIEKALANCPHVVVSEVVDKNDTLAFANISLPACGWSEKDGTVTNSERMISRQRALLTPYKEAMPDWKIICGVAKRLGFAKAFSYQHTGEIFCEHAALTGFENDGQRDLDLSELSKLDKAAFDLLSPIQWPVTTKSPQGTKRMFSDARFFTPSGRANFIAISPSLPQQLSSTQYPLILNTGRMRDQWHTMTRTGNAAKLHQHVEQAYVYIHPADASYYKLQDKDLVALHSKVNAASQHAPVIVPVKIDSKQRKGELFCPIHWSKTFSSHVNLAALFTSAVDPVSGQPELKHAAVSLSTVKPKMQMMLYSKQSLSTAVLNKLSDYYVIMKLENAWAYRLAIFDSKSGSSFNLDVFSQWTDLVALQLASKHETFSCDYRLSNSRQWLAMNGASLAVFCQVVSTQPEAQSNWLNHLFGQSQLEAEVIHKLMHNQTDSDFAKGKRVCSCFAVHENTIVDAIKQGLDSVSDLGSELKCGTNCGSCKSEIKQLIKQHAAPKSEHERIEITVEI